MWPLVELYHIRKCARMKGIGKLTQANEKSIASDPGREARAITTCIKILFKINNLSLLMEKPTDTLVRQGSLQQFNYTFSYLKYVTTCRDLP